MPQQTATPNTQGQYSPQNQSLEQLKAMMTLLKGSRNPNEMIKQLISQNPQYQSVMELVHQNGSPKAAFYALAQQKGINPDEFIKSLQS